jgi:GNAT superfamily N-acetyltransferase
MYRLSRIDNSNTASIYEKFTFPLYRPLLLEIKPEGNIIALAVHDKLEQPIGLIVAEIRESKPAKILSIFVEPNYRCQGIATALLMGLEQELQLRDCTQVKLDYTTGKPTTPALESLLIKCNWTTPVLDFLVCKADSQLLQAPWVKKEYHLPSSFTIFPWGKITKEERLEIEQKQKNEEWITPSYHIPFAHETKDLEALNSLGLRYKGQVVGWVLTHRIAPDTIRYTTMFVRQDLQKMARGIALVVKAIQLQSQAFSQGVNVPKAIWVVADTNMAMVGFVKKHMEHYLVSLQENKSSVKLLMKEEGGRQKI